MRVIFIRHGKTAGNLEGRYVGRTDEPLCEAGREEILKRRQAYPSVDGVYTSGKSRCVETAKLIYPELTPVRLTGFDECDFGKFEGKNYSELSGNEDYQRWIDSNGTLPFPGGETAEGFKKRCRETFERMALELVQNSGEFAGEEEKAAAFVVHGGTIMSVFSGFAEEKKGYYDWQIRNGEGFTARLELDGGQPVLREIRRI